MSIIQLPNVPLLQESLIDYGSGYYPDKYAFAVIGYSPAVNNALVDITNIGGATSVAYVFPAAAVQMAIVSSSANDTAAGTGIRTVRIHYLDANYAVQTEDITMNGVAPVNTVATNILRINGIHALTVGSGGYAAGNISLTNGGVTYAYINTGFNTSRSAVFTIPAGKTGYLTHFSVTEGTSAGAHYTRFILEATAHDNILLPGVFIAQDEMAALNGADSIQYDIPLHLPEKSDVKVSAISDSGAANAMCTAHISGWYE